MLTSRHWQIPRADTATLSEAHVTPAHGSKAKRLKIKIMGLENVIMY